MRRLNPGAPAQPAPSKRKPIRRKVFRGRLPLLLSIIVLAGTLGLGGAWLTASARGSVLLDRIVRGASAIGGLTVREVYVVNRRHTPSQALREALALQIGDPMLALDLEELRTRVRRLGWVEDAEVARQLPDRIVIRLTERTPVAILEENGRYRYIDAQGVLIGDTDGRFPRLKILTGVGAQHAAGALLALLAREPTLADQVVGAARVGDRRWDILLRIGVTIRLPEDVPDQAWEWLTHQIQTHALLDRDITIFDLRQPDRLIVHIAGLGPAPTLDRKT